MSADLTLEERKTLMLMKLRGYRSIERKKQEKVISFIAEMPKEGKKVLIWCIQIQGAVGVRYVDQMKNAMKKAEAEEGVIVTCGRYTPVAKVKAAEKGIELIPKTFPAFNIFEHTLVPKHEILSLEEKEEILVKYRVQPHQLPWIKASDPAAIAIGARPGDILRIIRESPTAGKYFSYRYVIED